MNILKVTLFYENINKEVTQEFLDHENLNEFLENEYYKNGYAPKIKEVKEKKFDYYT